MIRGPRPLDLAHLDRKAQLSSGFARQLDRRADVLTAPDETAEVLQKGRIGHVGTPL
jgi:hypothetical protein